MWKGTGRLVERETQNDGEETVFSGAIRFSAERAFRRWSAEQGLGRRGRSAKQNGAIEPARIRSTPGAADRQTTTDKPLLAGLAGSH